MAVDLAKVEEAIDLIRRAEQILVDIDPDDTIFNTGDVLNECVHDIRVGLERAAYADEDGED